MQHELIAALHKLFQICSAIYGDILAVYLHVVSLKTEKSTVGLVIFWALQDENPSPWNKSSSKGNKL